MNMDPLSLPRLVLFCVLFVCLLDFSVTDDCGELNPVVEPPHLVVRYGDPTSAVCTAPQPVDYMGWEAPGAGPKQRGTQQIVWNLTSVTDSFALICYTNSEDRSCEREVPVTVYVSPNNVTATVVNHTKPLIEGHQYHLACSVESVAPVQDLTIIWYRGDQAVGQSDYTRFSFIDIDPASVFDNLTITASRLDRGAIYSCAARLDLNTSKPIPVTRSNSILLEVLYGPIGLNHSGNVNVVVGNALELFCNAEANPIPTYNWTRNSITLEKENSGKLCIESVSVEHSGEYSCSVGNGIGSNQTAKMMVDVYYKPRMLNITGNVIIKAGNTLTLACHANANPTPFYQWRHNGTVLSNQKSDTLEIYSINVTNGGVYECMATNTQGQDSARMTVIVTVENYGDAVVIGTWTVVCVLALVIAAVCLWRRRRQQPQ